MKILVFSDIHGAAAPLEKIIEIFENEKFDMMIICGDYINYGPRNGIPVGYDPQKCIKILNTYSRKILGIRGNCDSEVDQMLLSFPILGDYAQLVVPPSKNNSIGMRFFIHHGHLEKYSRKNLSDFVSPHDENFQSIVISGHTHIPIFEEENGYIFLNPGSITFPKGDSLPSYIEINTETNNITQKTI